MRTECDVAIVGAGAAGLAAARVLSNQGMSVVVLDAAEATGGRIRTLRPHDWSMPVELGAEFVHGWPAPTVALGHGAFQYISVPERRAMRDHEHDLHRTSGTWQRFAKLMARAKDATPGESVLEYALKQRFGAEELALVRLMVEGYHAAPLDDVAATVIARDAAAQASELEQYRILAGYDAVVSELERGIEPHLGQIELGVRVKQIDWSLNGARLDVQAGASAHEIRARYCVVTASIGVLQASPEDGGIELRPRPAVLERELSKLSMGDVVKVVLRFETPLWPSEGPLSEVSFLHVPDSPFPTIWHQTNGAQEQITAWAAGPKAQVLLRENDEQIRDLALSRVALALGLDPRHCRRYLLEAHYADFTNSPLTRGAYSYVRPGGVDAAKRLAEPLDGTLFFAGEALDLQYPGTVAGAIGSGQHAARQLLTSCRRAA